MIDEPLWSIVIHKQHFAPWEHNSANNYFIVSQIQDVCFYMFIFLVFGRKVGKEYLFLWQLWSLGNFTHSKIIILYIVFDVFFVSMLIISRHYLAKISLLMLKFWPLYFIWITVTLMLFKAINQILLHC